jgi:regulator of sigma E protease
MLGSIIVFLLVLSLLVVVHEFGHYVVARLCGIWVEEFGFGIPPRIYGKKIGKTIYSINLFPFGGFVKLHGEMGDEEIAKPQESFIGKPKKTRIAVIFAGVFMNFLLAVVAFAIVYSFTGIPKTTDRVIVTDVAAGSPALEAGVLVGDRIVSVDALAPKTPDEFIKVVETKKGEMIKLTLERSQDGENVVRDFKVTPRVNPPAGQGSLGVTISNTEIYFPPIWQRPFVGAYWGIKESYYWGKTVVEALATTLTQLLHGKAPTDLSGPIGIFAVTTQAANFGLLVLINFIGILSVNLAVFNILPIPALDGGRLLFIAIETFFGRKVLPKVETAIHSIGLIVLILMILAITVKDIVGLVKAGSISKFLDNLTSQSQTK